MDLKELIENNKSYNLWRAAIEEDLQAAREDMIEENREFLSLEEFKKLSYEEALEVYKVIERNLDYNTQKKEVAKALKEIKENTFEIMKVAHYYPAINELEYLTDIQKNGIDSYLRKFRFSYVITGTTAWYKLKIDNKIGDKVLEDLYKKGILGKYYQIHCRNCYETATIISEEVYEKHRKFFKLVEKARSPEGLTEEEDTWVDEFQMNGRIWEVACISCEDGYYELEKFEQLEEGASIIYKNITEPDLTFENK